MFKERHIFCFANFIFKNGDPPLEKYFIILKELPNKLILGTLPTRTNKVPFFSQEATHGCINMDDRNFNCYYFEKGKKICKNDFCFDMPTFIYGRDIEFYEKELMTNDYKIEGKDYIIMGELNDEEYKNIIRCFLNSNSVKRGIQKKLSDNENGKENKQTKA